MPVSCFSLNQLNFPTHLNYFPPFMLQNILHSSNNDSITDITFMVNEAKKQAIEQSGNEKEKSKSGIPDSEPYDAIVIGAGICGIIFLKYALEKGLRCVALEKQSDVGGLWNRLPSWQDIQNRKQDFALDGIPLNGVDQPAVLQYAEEWIRHFGLDQHIQLGCEVTGASRTDGNWTVRTKQGDVFQANYLIVASGVQNDLWIPDMERVDSEIKETHSCNLRRPDRLAGQRVTVVGGGASSQDLVDLAIENGAKDIHWVFRKEVKWFLPT